MYQTNVTYKVGGYGNLLVSRWPIVEKHQISLRLKAKKPRGAQIAVVVRGAGAHRLTPPFSVRMASRPWR